MVAFLFCYITYTVSTIFKVFSPAHFVTKKCPFCASVDAFNEAHGVEHRRGSVYHARPGECTVLRVLLLSREVSTDEIFLKPDA